MSQAVWALYWCHILAFSWLFANPMSALACLLLLRLPSFVSSHSTWSCYGEWQQFYIYKLSPLADDCWSILQWKSHFSYLMAAHLCRMTEDEALCMTIAWFTLLLFGCIAHIPVSIIHTVCMCFANMTLFCVKLQFLKHKPPPNPI